MRADIAVHSPPAPPPPPQGHDTTPHGARAEVAAVAGHKRPAPAIGSARCGTRGAFVPTAPGNSDRCCGTDRPADIPRWVRPAQGPHRALGLWRPHAARRLVAPQQVDPASRTPQLPRKPARIDAKVALLGVVPLGLREQCLRVGLGNQAAFAAPDITRRPMVDLGLLVTRPAYLTACQGGQGAPPRVSVSGGETGSPSVASPASHYKNRLAACPTETAR